MPLADHTPHAPGGVSDFGRRRRAVFRVMAVVTALVLLEGGSQVAVRVLGPRLGGIQRTPEMYRRQTALIRAFLADDPTRLEEHDAVLGWRYRPGYAGRGNHINAQGLRSERDYAPVPPPGVVRVAAYGDSFVYGNEVEDGSAWPALLEAAAPDLEVLNYGVGGYGTDQALLRYEAEGAALAPHVVLIGFAPMDLRRVVNVYRRFISPLEGPWIKPRFRLTATGDLALLPNPVPRPSDLEQFVAAPAAVRALGAHDHWYEPLVYESPLYDLSAAVRLGTTLWLRVKQRYVDADRLLRGDRYNRESEAYAVQLAVFERFRAAVSAAGATPLVVILPDRDTVRATGTGAPPLYAPLLQDLATRGFAVLDLADAFRAANPVGGTDGWFMPGGHYSPAGNRVVAEWLAPRIPRDGGPVSPAA